MVKVRPSSPYVADPVAMATAKYDTDYRNLKMGEDKAVPLTPHVRKLLRNGDLIACCPAAKAAVPESAKKQGGKDAEQREKGWLDHFKRVAMEKAEAERVAREGAEKERAEQEAAAKEKREAIEAETKRAKAELADLKKAEAARDEAQAKLAAAKKGSDR